MDKLGPARGCLVGVLLAGVLWVLIIAAILNR